MDARSISSFPVLRDVVCMFCAWSWMTSRKNEEKAAKCPRCGHPAGVEAFMVIGRADQECLIVKPAPWHL
jgi:hypothetical protein